LLGVAVQRIITTIPKWTEHTTTCSVALDGETLEISNAFVKKVLPPSQKIGSQSICSGAAMSIFLMDHLPAKIMILGRWSSDTFLVYIQPQVLKWTHNMSWEMIHLDSFFDASHQDLVTPNDP
jgi:hypothetical protein